MKNIILTYEGYETTNLGDYIQSLAASQFMPQNEDVIYHNRDELNIIDFEARAILNGWFTHKPENWPPSEKLKCLFVAFHINSSVYDKLLNDQGIAYLKQHEPIGCRDLNTVKILESHGVQAYFSSCLTTTLGFTYPTKKSIERNGKIYVVDAVHYVPEAQRRLQKYKFLPYFLCNFPFANQLLTSFRHNEHCRIDYTRFCGIVRSALLLKKLLPTEELKNVEVLTQFHRSKDYPTREQRFNRAKELLSLYSQAKLVITSRIHVALPCLGLGTPVIFLQNMDDSMESRCRFTGLIDLLNVIQFRRDEVIHTPFALPLKPDEIKNSNRYKQYAEELINKCRRFMGDSRNEYTVHI